MLYKPSFPVVGARRDILGAVTPTQISGEAHHVADGYIKLREVPQSSTSTQSVIIPGYTEVYAAPTGYQFRVNYTTGRVFFHTSQEGALVKATYKGLGSLTAVDEINWLWERLTTYQTFGGLFDTPDSYENNAYSFLQVNKTETGLEFVAPSIGRSACRMLVMELAPNTPVSYDAANNDVVTVYEIIPRNDTSPIAPGQWVMEPAGGIIVVEEAGSDVYALAAPAAGVTCTMRADAMLDLAGWNIVTGIDLICNIPANTAVRAMLIVDGVPHHVTANTFVPAAANTAADVVANGSTPAELSALSSAQLDALVGHTIGLIVALTSVNGVATPSFDGYLHLQGQSGGGYTQVNYVDITLNTQDGKWTFTSTAAATKNILVVVGSGRDDICCSSDALVFEDVPAGGELTVRAPKQTTLQVYERLETSAEALYTVTAPADWVSVDGALEASLGAPTNALMQFIAAAKNINTAYTSLHSLLTLENGSLTDKLGHYTFVNRGAKTIVPGFVGPALYMSGTSHLRISDSWVFEASQGGVYSDLRYANRAVGGLFKWVSGYPAIITPYCSQGYIAAAGGWYQNCAAYLAKNYVGFNCGRTWKYIYYPEGSWVFAAIYAIWGRWVAGVHDNKQLTGYCNGSAVNVYHAESSNTSFIDRNAAIPGAIGNGSSQIPTTGAFMVDTAFSARVANPGATAFDNMRNLETTARQSAYDARHFYTYKLAAMFSNLTWPQVKSITVTQKQAVCANVSRFLIESAGVLYVYDFTAGAFTAVSAAQPIESLWDLGIPEDQIAAIPDWKLDGIASTAMNIWAISQMSAASGLTPTDAYKGEVARIYTPATVYAGDRLQAWKMLSPDDFSLTWVEESKAWKLVNNAAGTRTLRIIVSGQAAQQALGAALFTDLADTPDDLTWEGPRLLVAGDGVVTTRPYINPLMMGTP